MKADDANLLEIKAGLEEQMPGCQVELKELSEGKVEIRIRWQDWEGSYMFNDKQFVGWGNKISMLKGLVVDRIFHDCQRYNRIAS